MHPHRHFIMHKPFGFLSQLINNQNKRRNKPLLAELYSFPEGTMAIGRLDQKSEGLLLLTTDGKESERIRSNQIEKEYAVMVDGLITTEAIQKMRQGVEINIEGKHYQTLPCKVETLDIPPVINTNYVFSRAENHGPTSWISVVLNEGKFRQIRKMTAVVGFPTLRLIRVRIGRIQLGVLKEGEVVELERFNC